MFRNALFALAALATASIVTADDANAVRAGGGGISRGGGMAHAHAGGGMRHMGGMRHADIRHIHARRHVLPHRFHPHFRHRAHFWPRPFCWRFPWRCRGPIYTRYVVPTYVAAAPVAYAAAPAAPSRCTCLTKQYLQDGSVLFKDVCTREEALLPSPSQQQSQLPYPAPQVR